MERTSLPGLAAEDAGRPAAAGLPWLWLQLEPLALRRLLVDHAGLTFTSLACCLAAAVYASESLTRHREFQSNAYDLGFFDQIVWNTSQGRFFETSFVGYNFLGQHFDPVLLLFAAAYRLGSGVELLLMVQAMVVALAVLPLFLAARRISGSQAIAGLSAAAYLLNAPIHAAVMFDFHPETAAFFFLFLGVYFLVAQRPTAACIAVLPLFSLKEDMDLIVLVFAALLWLRGHRIQAKWLAGGTALWLMATVFVVMPLIRGGDSDLTQRYSYLIEGSNALELLPIAAGRATEHLAESTLSGLIDLLSSVGFLPLLSPLAFLATAPLILVNGLSDHPEQAHLKLHYAVPALALLWLATLLALDWLTRHGRRPSNRRGRLLPAMAGVVILVGALQGSLATSPFAPGQSLPELAPTHRDALQEALRLIPKDASVNAQSSLLPHISQRRQVYEFPDRRQAGYVIVDSGLPVSGQSHARGYTTQLDSLGARGYERIFEREGVQLWRYAP